jgi:ATP-binding cassette subfamily B protein
MKAVNRLSAHLITDHRSLAFLAFGVFVTLALGLAVNIWQRRLSRHVIVQFERNYYRGGIAKSLALPHRYHLVHNAGETTTTITRGNERLVDLVWFSAYDFLPTMLSALITLVVLFFVDGRFFALIGGTAAFYIGYLVVNMRRTRSMNEWRHKVWKRVDQKTGQALANVMSVQAFARESAEVASVTADLDLTYDLFFKEFDIHDTSTFFRRLLVVTVRPLLLFWTGVEVLHGRMAMGTLLFLFVLADRLFTNLYEIAMIYEKVIVCLQPVRRFKALLDETGELPNGSGRPPKGSPELCFENVSYTYQENGAKPALAGLSFTIRAGEVIGVVGESGHGKSTFAKLLLRFFDPTSGSVSWNATDLRDFDLGKLREAIGYVPQEVELFDATIFENIAYGVPDATEMQVVEAAKLSGAHEFISALKDGYQTTVGDRGLKLSGGQRQRIGIARAILKQPSLLVFDEATSAIDPISIRKIMEAVERLRGTCTMVLVSHQLSTIQHADRILVLEHGQLAEIGTHAELLKQNGLYRRLVDIQQRVEHTL